MNFKATFYTEKHTIHCIIKAKTSAYAYNKCLLIEKYLNDNCYQVGRKAGEHIMDLFKYEEASDSLVNFYKNNIIKVSKKGIDNNLLIIDNMTNQTVLF